MSKINSIKKAIIIVAGMGSRLNSLTNDKPKCLLKIRGKSILEMQLETLRSGILCGGRSIFLWLYYGIIKEKLEEDYEMETISNNCLS